MELLEEGVLVGVLGTLLMDSLNLLFARNGMLSRIDMGMIGRMAVGWARGRFCYGNPGDMREVANEKLYGLGVFGRRSPEGVKASLSSLANHLFYGLGLAVGVTLV